VVAKKSSSLPNIKCFGQSKNVNILSVFLKNSQKIYLKNFSSINPQKLVLLRSREDKYGEFLKLSPEIAKIVKNHY